MQPKTEPGSSPIFDSSDNRNVKEINISEIVSVLRADVDRVEEVLLARDAKHKSEIGPLQEKVEFERLMRIQVEEELKKKEEQRQKGKRAQESYEALLKKVKEIGLRDQNTIEELRNKNRELELEILKLKELKRKRVDDSIAVAELRIKVGELENANKKNLEIIDKLRAENTKLEREKIKSDAELLGNVYASVVGNTEREPQLPPQRNIDTGHTLGALDMADKGIPTGRGRGRSKKVSTSIAQGRGTSSTTAPPLIAVNPTFGTPTPIAPTTTTPIITPTPTPTPIHTPTPSLSIGHTRIASGQYLEGQEPNRIRFDGKNGWKPPNRGLHRVTEVIQTMFDAPYKNFTEVPKATREIWWREWKKDYLIFPEEEGLIREAFMYRCGKRIREMYRDIRIGKGLRKWMPDAYLRVLREYWDTEEFKATQEKAKANRASLKGGSLHTGGSTTIEGTRTRMAKELQRSPTQSELFMETHMKKIKRGREWVDARSKQTYTKYQQRLKEAQLKHQTQVDAGEDPTPINEELIWLQTVGGPYKGRVYGIGHYGYTESMSPTIVNGSAAGDDA